MANKYFLRGNCTHIKPKRAVFRTGKIERTVEGSHGCRFDRTTDKDL